LVGEQFFNPQPTGRHFGGGTIFHRSTKKWPDKPADCCRQATLPSTLYVGHQRAKRPLNTRAGPTHTHEGRESPAHSTKLALFACLPASLSAWLPKCLPKCSNACPFRGCNTRATHEPQWPQVPETSAAQTPAGSRVPIQLGWPRVASMRVGRIEARLAPVMQRRAASHSFECDSVA